MTGEPTHPGLVAVLGASGYIGSSVIAALSAHPDRIRAVARRPSHVSADAHAQTEVVTADLTVRSELAAAVRHATAVVHLVADIDHSAGRSWRVADDGRGERHNLGPVRDLIDVLAERGGPPATVVLAGTTSQVGAHPRLRIDGSELDQPETFYDRQKLAAEQALLAAHAAGVLCAVPLRLPTIYGAGVAGGPSGAGVVAAMIRRAVSGQPLTMWHDGSVVRDLLHVSDVAGAVQAALARPGAVGGRSWLLGSGAGVPLGALFHRISTLTAEITCDRAVPVSTVCPPDYATAEDFRGVEVEAGPFRWATGWRPRMGLDDGLRGAIEQADTQRKFAAAGATS